jgi:RimJ/RimL family protein N-acetyltransferase
MLKSERLILRPICEEDIEWLRETRNKHKNDFFDSNEITAEQQKQWYQRYREVEGRDQMFIIQLKDGTPIGTVAVYDIDIASRAAKFGRFLLLDEYRHCGYAEEAVKCLLNYCWNTMRLYKLKVEVYLDNLDAMAIYARAGFAHKRPIIILEKINDKADFRKPMRISSYDDMSECGYEGQVTNVK